MMNPYTSLPDFHFWRRAVGGVEPFLLDPVVGPRDPIERHQRVATAGSCFAQHIATRLESEGFNYFVTEPGEHLAPEDRRRHGFGVFSARFGNIYTARQLLQLFREAFGQRPQVRLAWQRNDRRWVDAMRPQVEPDGYPEEGEVHHERDKHLDAVRRMFVECNVFVFTLGLTEAWRSRVDGTVFPLAPGVVAGTHDPELHEFVNFRASEVIADMSDFLREFKGINANARVVLTVSPVPLIATYEARHVLESNTVSKSILRVAADEIAESFEWVDYFPSFEVITGNFNDSAYYEKDYRSINILGVDHAMRCFLRHYTRGQAALADTEVQRVFQPLGDVICDEEAIDQVR